MRKRPESEGRLLAGRIPDDARVVGLVYVPEEGGRGPRTAEAVATAVARRREHTLLAPLGPAPEALRASEGDAPLGLHDALQGRVGLTEVARRHGARPFVYLPAGQDPPEPAEMLEHPAFGDFASKVRRRGGTLLLLIPAPALEAAAATGLLDGYLSLGDAVPAGAGDLPELGRVRPPEESGSGGGEERGPARELAGPARVGDDAAVAAAAADRPSAPMDAAPAPGAPEAEPSEPAGRRPEPPTVEAAGVSRGDEGAEPAEGDAPGEGPGSWRRHRSESRLPLVKVGLAALVVLALVAGWWLFARESAPSRPAPAPTAGLATPAEADRAADDGPDPAALRAAVTGSTELAYSVLIASYASRPDADDRLSELEGGGGLFFVAPTPVRGALYWRVFAGARPGADAARALMESLVERGLKDQAGSWHVRPVGLTYLLGVHGGRSAAERAAADAREEGISAYVIGAATGEDSAFAVYAGAYESEEAALPMEELLDEAGREAALVPRRGSAP